MLPFSPRRLLRSRLLRLSLLLLVVWTCIEAVLINRRLIIADEAPVRSEQHEKIFIALLPWNNEIILRQHLNSRMLDLVRVLGIANVYFSIYENGSGDGTKGALRDLQSELDSLSVPNHVVLEEISHEDIVRTRPTGPTEGWIRIDQAGHEAFDIHRGDYALRRIHYLAGLRNKVLEPLGALARNGSRFDRILFLNDVLFTPDDVLRLLQTRDGDYAAACSLDFELPPAFYDTFALRDAQGRPALMKTWPFFHAAGSRNAMLTGGPVPVQSCWNGIVALNAAPFLPPDPSTTDASPPPLRFRAVPDSLARLHVEGSECCLVHYDNPLTPRRGVWLNSAVRVGYCHPGLRKGVFAPDWAAYKRACQLPYDAVHVAPGRSWIGVAHVAAGLWENRVRRVVLGGARGDWRAARKARAWARVAGGQGAGERQEPGAACLVDEMHVIEPHGWLHL